MNEAYKRMIARLKAFTVTQVARVDVSSDDLIDPDEGYYSRYVGYATHGACFEKAAYENLDYFGIGLFVHEREALRPPQAGSWIAGDTTRNSKGPYFAKWCTISGFELLIRIRLLTAPPARISENTIEVMSSSQGSKESRLLVDFAHLVINGDIEYYLAHKESGTLLEAERMEKRTVTDVTVYNRTKDLLPDLWDRYRAASLARKLYSDIILEPKILAA